MVVTGLCNVTYLFRFEFDENAELRNMGKLMGFLQIIRPLNCLMMGFAVIVGASLVSSLSFTMNPLTAASMVINDFYDRKIDAINEPNRPIPRGDVSPKESLFFALVLSLIAFTAAFETNSPSLVVAVIAWIISITYITKGKGTGLPGNFLVSTTVVIPFVYGGLTVGQLETSTLLFVAIVFLSNTGREITKGIVDVEGDRSHNIKTIAVTHGERSAATVAAVFSFLAVSLSPLPWMLGIVSDWFLPPVILTDLGLIISSFMLLRDYSRTNAKKIKTLSLVWFVTGLLSFILGTL